MAFKQRKMQELPQTLKELIKSVGLSPEIDEGAVWNCHGTPVILHKALERIADKAEKKDQYAAAINSEYTSGQLASMYVDKREVRVTGLEGMSREELEGKLKELTSKIDGYNAKTIDAQAEEVSKKLEVE